MSTGGLIYKSKKHFDEISLNELKKQIDWWNKEREVIMTEEDSLYFKNIVNNNYDKNKYLTLKDLEEIEKMDKTNILKSLKKFKIKREKVYSKGSRPIIIIHRNDVEIYLKEKYGNKNI